VLAVKHMGYLEVAAEDVHCSHTDREGKASLCEMAVAAGA
jgi:hypothetical protein